MNLHIEITIERLGIYADSLRFPIGRFGSTDASVSLARVNAWVNAEHP